MILPSATRATELEMKFPPAKIGQNERPLGAHEISALSCTDMARKFVEGTVKQSGSRWTVDLNGEMVSHHDEFGYVYRYIVTSNFKENGKNYSHEFIYVLWSKDCKSMGIVSFPTLDLKLPRSPKGL
jgi:hypothetical protein